MITELLWFLLIALVINGLMFLVAYARQTDKLTDISYAVTFVALAIYGLAAHGTTPAGVLVGAMVSIWALRLGTFLLIRVRRNGRDKRFDEMRSSFTKFGRFWLVQGFSVWVIMFAAMLAMMGGGALETLSLVGASIWAAGLVLEAVADAQKFRFSADPANRGKWIDQGVWHLSRHPNYFGEILVWAGLYVAVAPYLSGAWLAVGAVSPLFITVLLLFVSGIPLLEKKADERWGGNEQYLAYKKRTSLLVPWWPKAT